MDSQQPQLQPQYYYQYQQQIPQEPYRNNSQSPAPVLYQAAPPMYMQPHPQCICQQAGYHQYQQPQLQPHAQDRDITEIVTSVIGDERIKENLKDQEIKVLKEQLDILDNKLSEMIAKKVKKFCF